MQSLLADKGDSNHIGYFYKIFKSILSWLIKGTVIISVIFIKKSGVVFLGWRIICFIRINVIQLSKTLLDVSKSLKKYTLNVNEKHGNVHYYVSTSIHLYTNFYGCAGWPGSILVAKANHFRLSRIRVKDHIFCFWHNISLTISSVASPT